MGYLAKRLLACALVETSRTSNRGTAKPLTALQDHDLDVPNQVEMAYYAIRNAFAAHVLKREVDPWLVVNQALSAIGEAEAVHVFEEVLNDEA